MGVYVPLPNIHALFLFFLHHVKIHNRPALCIFQPMAWLPAVSPSSFYFSY
nr:MAG TPA: hypothetical protein [Caudoviricetes sp.]